MPKVDVATIAINDKVAWVEHDRRGEPHTIKVYERGAGDTKKIIWSGETSDTEMSRSIFVGLCHAQVTRLGTT